jgi:hypothetical protein
MKTKNNVMKTKNLVFVFLIYIVILISWSKFGNTQGISVNILKQIEEWLGEKSTFKKHYSLGWLEVDVYSARNGDIFVDSDSKEIIGISFRLKQSKAMSDLGMNKCLECAIQWMEQRGISTNGWRLEEKRRYERGNGRIEYMFTWFKYSPERVLMPSFMKVLISGEGTVNYWFRIDKPISISLVPKVSEEEAILKAQSIVGKQFKIERRPILRVWFRNKKQELWWEVVLKSFEKKIIIIINAHSGELIDIISFLGGSNEYMEKDRQMYLRNAWKIEKDLEKCVKIEIFHRNVFNKPIAIFKQNSKKFQELLFAVRKLLREGEGIIGGPPQGLLAEFSLKFYITPNIAYEAKFDISYAYFEIFGKFKMTKKGKKEIWEIIETLPVIVHKCPQKFIEQMSKIIKQIPIPTRP